MVGSSCSPLVAVARILQGSEEIANDHQGDRPYRKPQPLRNGGVRVLGVNKGIDVGRNDAEEVQKEKALLSRAVLGRAPGNQTRNTLMKRGTTAMSSPLLINQAADLIHTMLVLLAYTASNISAPTKKPKKMGLSRSNTTEAVVEECSCRSGVIRFGLSPVI
jgi:hypothetical protein